MTLPLSSSRPPECDGDTLLKEPAPALAEDPLLGAVLGSFRLERPLGQGGMGTVYLGRHLAIGSRVAVKVLHPQLAGDPGLVARFQDEARAVNRVAHPNIVQIFDLGVAPTGQPYLVMELLDGRPLSELAMPLPQQEAVALLVQICEALGAAHASGIVHRDLKPENVFLVEGRRGEPVVKLLDFGIAKILSEPSAQTVAGMLLGTPEYMSPEQCIGAPVDGRTDLYALGLIAYQLLTGNLPFRGTLLSLLHAHQHATPVPLRSLDPSVGAGLAAVVERCLRKAPSDRPQSAEVLARELLEASARHDPRAVEGRSPSRCVRIHQPGEGASGRLPYRDLTRGGLFVSTSGIPPPLFTTLRLEIEVPGGVLTGRATVVRHVSGAEAAAWAMPGGFGVQFDEPGAAFREGLGRALQGLPQTPPPAAAPLPQCRDPEAELALSELRGRDSSDAYALLELPQDTAQGAVRQRARSLFDHLSRLRRRPLCLEQVVAVESLEERVRWAETTLGIVERRAPYDARRGNYRGVARCLGAGLTVQHLEALRQAFVAESPASAAAGQKHELTSAAYLRQNKQQEALQHLELALRADPLNLRLHHLFWARRGVTSGARQAG